MAAAAGALVLLVLIMGVRVLHKGVSKEDAGIHPISSEEGRGGELHTLLDETKQQRLASMSQTSHVQMRQDTTMNATNDPSAIVAALYPSAVAEAQRADRSKNKNSGVEREYWSTEDDEEDGNAILNAEIRGMITNRINEAAAAPI